jgi:Arc/MetJ-type ribon-helix-helix transcriptional regulator
MKTRGGLKRSLFYNEPTKRVNICLPEDQLNAMDSYIANHHDFRGRSEFISAAISMMMGGKFGVKQARACRKCRRSLAGDKHVFCANCVAGVVTDQKTLSAVDSLLKHRKDEDCEDNPSIGDD